MTYMALKSKHSMAYMSCLKACLKWLHRATLHDLHEWDCSNITAICTILDLRIIVVGTERRLCHLGQILHIFTSITFILCYRFVSLCIMSHPRSNIHVFRVQREYVYVCIWKCNSLQENSEQELPEARKELLTRKSVNQFTSGIWKGKETDLSEVLT